MLTAEEILGPQGRIAARMDHYEQRSEQLAMARAVDDAIRGQHHLIAEAGTGEYSDACRSGPARADTRAEAGFNKSKTKGCHDGFDPTGDCDPWR